jgi:hypothetical protein
MIKILLLCFVLLWLFSVYKLIDFILNKVEDNDEAAIQIEENNT